jgi:hypothetical protein
MFHFISLFSTYPNLFLPIKIRIELISKRITRVVESQLLINALNLLHILRRELEIALQVRLYARWSLGFREDGVALCNAPRESYLRTGLVVFLGDFDEDGIILYVP